MAKGWVRAVTETPDLADKINIVGMVDLNPAAAQALAEEFGLRDAVVATSLSDILNTVQADLVFDVVIPVARFDVVSTALRAGCHVLSEKPMANTLDEAKALVSLASETGRVHAVVQNRRFIEGIRRMRAFIDSGAIGDLTAVHCDFFLAPHFGGFRDEMQHVLLLDMAIHTFDAARFVANRQPLSVYCVERNPRGSWYAHGASANAIFEFSDDVVFTYRGSWCAEGRRTSWESQWRLVGSKGMLTWDGEEAFEATVAGDEPGLLRGFSTVNVSGDIFPGETHGHASVLQSFIAAVEGGGAPETVGSDNINSLAMVFAAIESAQSGKRIDISASL
ncbi:putative dehydrogenase [Rhizobium taibaishanense]|nr:putative dehydrogenase [Allorhizobium taibaishanense]